MARPKPTRAINPESTALSDLDIFRPKEISSGIYGVEDVLEDLEVSEDDEEIVVFRCQHKRAKTSNAGLVPFPNLSKANPAIQKLANDPRTAARWCLVRDGELFQPRSVNRLVTRGWLEELGSVQDCRRALLLLYLNPPIEAFGVFSMDGELTVFPVDPPPEPGVTLTGRLEIQEDGKLEDRAPEEPTRAPEEIPQRKLEIPEDGKSPDRAPEPEEQAPVDPDRAPESKNSAKRKNGRRTGMRKNSLFDSVLSAFGRSGTKVPAGGEHV